MISKQEGGTDRGRLLLPGEQGDWAARNLIPLPPRLFMAPLSRRRAPSPGVRGSEAPGGPAWSRGGGDTTKYGQLIWIFGRALAPHWSMRRVASLFSKTHAK